MLKYTFGPNTPTLTNNHFHIPTTDPLRSFVHSIWHMERQGVRHTETIIPKGVVEIIFNFSSYPPIEASIGNQHFSLGKCFINGFNTLPISMSSSAQQAFLGIRFHPSVIKQIFKIPSGEFSNQAINLDLIDPGIHTLWHQLAETNNFESRLLILTQWIREKFKPLQPRDILLNQFLHETKASIPSVTELANSLYYSTRQLSRKLQELTGINTEQILAYKKFQLAVDLMHRTDTSLTQIAYESQFADQSHFIKNFRSFADLTPSEYLKCRSNLPGHIYKDVR